jgi:dTDP-4-amino-4,6-dideoxygalactose transaminase
MEKKRLYLSSPTMHGEEMEYIREAFETNWVAPLGPNVDAFERETAAYIGVGHAAALSSGTRRCIWPLSSRESGAAI